MRRMRFITVLAIVVGAFAVLATNALATTGSGGSGQAESQDKASATVLADVKIKGKIDRRSCKWVTGGWNSGVDANGKLQWFWDGKRAKVCRNKKSPTGWVKVAGGLTGRNCGNPWRFKKPKVVVQNVVMIRKWIKVTVSATASVRVDGSCGFAEASATATATVKARTYAKGKNAAQVLAYATARAQATAKASASLSCTTPPPPPPSCEELGNCPPPSCEELGTCPVDHPPHIDVFNSPAHLYVNGNFYVYIEAYDEDGDAVSVSTSASGSGTITLPTPSLVRWDGSPCPVGKSCYRARVQASSTPGLLTLGFSVTANGKTETKTVTLPVMADDFGG